MSGLIEHARRRGVAAPAGAGVGADHHLRPAVLKVDPTRGKEDGAAGSVAGPWELMHRTLRMCTPLLAMPPEPYQKPEHKGYPVGVVVAFCDWELMADLKYIASLVGLREHHHLAWCRTRNGGGAMFRGSQRPGPGPVEDLPPAGGPRLPHPELVRGRPRAAAGRTPTEAGAAAGVHHPAGRQKGGLILDPFAGSGASRTAAENLKLDLAGGGCDIDQKTTQRRTEMAVRGSTRGFRRTAAVRGNTSGPGQLQERRDQVRSRRRQVVRHSVRPPRRLGGHPGRRPKGLEVYEVMHTPGPHRLNRARMLA